MKYNTISEYIFEIKRTEQIISSSDSYKLKNDLRKYIKKLKKEMNNLCQKNN